MKHLVGRKIKDIRISRMETLEEFAEQIKKYSDNTIKTGKSNVSRWERGENVPNSRTLKVIAKLGGIAVDGLLGGACNLCEGSKYTADWYVAHTGLESLHATFTVTEDKKIIIDTYDAKEDLGFIEIDISYCPGCGRKLQN